MADLLRDVRAEVRRRKLSIDGDTWQAAMDGRFRALVAQGRIEEARERLHAGLGIGEAAS